VSLRGGRTIGDVPFDELFTLGFDRDTPLRLRGHPGLRAGQKGGCAAGKEFCAGECGDGQDCLSEWISLLKTGPFVDTGKTYDLRDISDHRSGFGIRECRRRSACSAVCRLFLGMERIAFGKEFIFHDGDEIARRELLQGVRWFDV